MWFHVIVVAFAVWMSLALVQRAKARLFPKWWLRAALCVHSHEAGWHYPGPGACSQRCYGGMQFDLPTWLANGGGRYARYPHWATPTQQLRVAYVTWRRRGWQPWPNTARMCGLL